MHIKFVSPDPRAGMVAQMDSGRGQHFVDTGAAVLLNADGTEVLPPTLTARQALDQAIAALPADHDDVEYVVRGMRSYFRSVFTDSDEKAIRELFIRSGASLPARLDRLVQESTAAASTSAPAPDASPAAPSKATPSAEPAAAPAPAQKAASPARSGSAGKAS